MTSISSPSDTLSVVVVGAGYFAQYHLEAWQRLPGVRLAAIIEADQTKHNDLKQQYPQAKVVANLADNASDISIVDIATPPATHAALIEQSLLHTPALIVCQKPFCRSLQEAQQLADRIHTENRTLVVHENFRFQPWYQKIKLLLGENLLGHVQQATFKLRPGDGQGPTAYLQRQPYFQTMPRFLIHETGIHFIDVFRYLFGEPDAVAADLRRLNPYIKGEDAGTFTFQYSSGLRASFDGNRHLDHAAENTRLTLGEMLIEGTKGSLTLNGFGEIHHRSFGSTTANPIPYELNKQGFGADCVYQLQLHIVNHLTLGTNLHNNVTEYLHNLRLEALVYQASSSQRTLNAHTGQE